MGGPWNGDLYQDDFLISSDVLLDVMVHDADSGIIYFVQRNKYEGWYPKHYFAQRNTSKGWYSNYYFSQLIFSI